MLPGRRAGLVKLDIEGGEQDLFSADLAWLDRVDAIIAELHRDMIDYAGIVAAVRARGFRHIPAGRAWRGSLECFVRDADCSEL
jgi:hypothetical protein